MPGRRKVTAQVRQKIWGMEFEGYSTRQIASALGISIGTVHRYRRVKGTQPNRRMITKYQIERIHHLYREGVRPVEIAEQVGMSLSTVYRYSPGGIKQQHYAEELQEKVDELIAQGITTRREHARIIGVAEKTLYDKLGPVGAYYGEFTVTTKQVKEIRERFWGGETMDSIAASYGLKSRHCISQIINKRGRFEFV